MRALVIRDEEPKIVTLGKLYLPWLKNHPDLYTLELPWLDNQPHISCIPVGLYKLKPFKSPKHGDIWMFQNVDHRSSCEIHAANFACPVDFNGKHYESQLEGCMAVGFGINDKVPMIEKSDKAIDYLRTTIGINSEWELEIKNA